jgi:DNA polymerase-3 subunit epsilon
MYKSMKLKMDIEDLVAVVDTETTGLFPGGHDRMVEVAALLLDYQGNLVDSYETLLNPARDLGPTHIHGIRAEEIISAPSFEEIAGDLVSFLSRASLLVGHNVFFDVRFIEAELRRIGIDITWRPPLGGHISVHGSLARGVLLPVRCCFGRSIPLRNG